MPELGSGVDEGSEGSEKEIAAETSVTKRAREAARFGGIGEVQRPPKEWIS